MRVVLACQCDWDNMPLRTPQTASWKKDTKNEAPVESVLENPKQEMLGQLRWQMLGSDEDSRLGLQLPEGGTAKIKKAFRV
jgi:hypothetical protein